MNTPSHKKLPEEEEESPPTPPQPPPPPVCWWNNVRGSLDRLLLPCLKKSQSEPVKIQRSYRPDQIAVDLDINEKPQRPSERCREWVEAASMWRLELPPPPPLKPGLNPIFLDLLTPANPPPMTSSNSISIPIYKKSPFK